jgi:hypothetical protein
MGKERDTYAKRTVKLGKVQKKTEKDRKNNKQPEGNSV